MPTPKEDETKDEYISRCLEAISKEKDKEGWTQEHKLGYCFGLWKEKEAEELISKRIMELFHGVK